MPELCQMKIFGFIFVYLFYRVYLCRMLFRRILIFIVVVSLMFSSCGNDSENITISGAFALYPLAVKWRKEYKKLHPEVRIDIVAGGAG